MNDPSRRDQRFFPRRSARPVPVLLFRADRADPPIFGQVRDYSPSGVNIQVEEAVAIGTMLLLRLASPNPSEWEPRLLVEHCHFQDGEHRLGCKFSEMQHWDELQVFG